MCEWLGGSAATEESGKSPEGRPAAGSRTLAAAALLVGLAAASVGATTLCVNPGGTAPCMSSIVAAVGAAQPGDTILVAPGTYAEGQTIEIDMPLSLIGEDRDTTTIDASGQVQGVYVNGLDNPGLGDVTVSGFTIENADNEGVLVTNATNVTISGNRVVDNDTGYMSGCPTLPGFETFETFDCGEGVHLLGAQNSMVTANMVEGNAGGILLTDDTGATDGNTISNNVAQDNPYDCGITLASHPYYLSTEQSPIPPKGVFDNTVTGNVSRRNGREGAGGGVGIFASVPGAAAYGNTVMDNHLQDNGLPGVAMHGHAPGQNLDGNVIMHNWIAGNGADTEDAATPGPTGINIYSVSDLNGTVVESNMIDQEGYDIAVKAPTDVSLALNRFVAKSIGVANLGGGGVDASQNWWGCPKGPDAHGCAAVQGAVTTSPWLTRPFGN